MDGWMWTDGKKNKQQHLPSPLSPPPSPPLPFPPDPPPLFPRFRNLPYFVQRSSGAAPPHFSSLRKTERKANIPIYMYILAWLHPSVVPSDGIVNILLWHQYTICTDLPYLPTYLLTIERQID
jgi:hypothetical protein